MRLPRFCLLLAAAALVSGCNKPDDPVVGELEAAVLYQLSIETAVSSVVDILEEDAVHSRLYRCARFLGINSNNVLLCAES